MVILTNTTGYNVQRKICQQQQGTIWEEKTARIILLQILPASS